MKPHVTGFIFARGGSKGVPGKNIRLLAGKPLIAYAIETALQSAFIDRVIVSTEDERIARIAEEFGAEVPFVRPPELAQDDSPEFWAWQHAVRFVMHEDKARKVEVFVSVPPTAPLRTVEDVDSCIRCFLESDADTVITVKKAGHHPSFNMVVLDQEGYARLAMPPAQAVIRRQDAPQIYDMATVAYVSMPDFILRAKRTFFEGSLKAVVIPEERAVDIDSELDFRFAEFLLAERQRKDSEKH